jgi:alpha-L-fucosidase 2
MDIRYDGGGGVYANLFDACPPFQIDGNFGTIAAIAEMLVQSGNNEIRLLPALPDGWKDGNVTGLCARGGFEVSTTWKEGRLTSATIHSLLGGAVRVRYQNQSAEVKIRKGESLILGADLSVAKGSSAPHSRR